LKFNTFKKMSTTELRKNQKEFSHALHGENAGAKTGISALLSKNKAAQEVAVADYLKHWDGKTDKEAEDRRLEDYNQSTHSYYNVVTDFYEYGWGTSFHFSRFYPGEPFRQATARHEHYLAHKIGIKEGWKVLDVGCGVGGPAREIARFTGAHITGLNNNDYQIEKAFYYANKFGLENQMNFVKGDFMKMDFEPESFDAVYAIEATVHAPVLEGVYSEIYKVLKPGGAFGVYEWVMTDKYDETNPEHRKIAYEIEIGDGIPKMYDINVARQALKNVGFELEFEQDLADMGDSIPWYYPLTGEWKYVQSLYDIATFFRTSSLGRKITTAMVGLMETVGIAPKGSQKVTLALEEAAVGLVEGGRQKLFTPMQLFVVRKPLNS
jgi:sterol 24-C-methyltransferase